MNQFLNEIFAQMKGTILCSQSYCCQTDLEGTMVGACTYHRYHHLYYLYSKLCSKYSLFP